MHLAPNRESPPRCYAARSCFATMVMLLALTAASPGQYYSSQDGHLLDANPRIGSMGWNTPARLDALIPRANLYITGNIGGGARFQGLVPYRSTLEFGGDVGGISVLSDFRRDSVGVEDMVNPAIGPRPFIDYSRQVTRTYGTGVLSTSQIVSRLPVTPVGASLRPGTLNHQQYLNTRRAGESFSSLRLAPSIQLPAIETPSYSRTAPAYPWMGQTSSQVTPDQPYPMPQTRLPQQTSVHPDTFLSKEPQQPTDQQELSQTEKPWYRRIESPLEDPSPTDKDMTELPSAPPQRDLSIAPPAYQPSSPAGQTQTPQPVWPGSSAQNTSSLAPVPAGSVDLERYARAAASQARKYMQIGRERLKQRQYYRAANAFDSAAIYDPQNPQVYAQKAYALFAAGEFMSAAYFLHKTLEFSPGFAQEQTDLRQLFATPADFEKRMQDLTDCQKRSGHPMLLFLKGYVQYQTGQLEPAEQSLTASLEAQPQAEIVKLLLYVVRAVRIQAEQTPVNSSPPSDN